MKILVVEDARTSRLITEVTLRKLGHECRSVVDGAQAWESFQSDPPDVVLSDWMMPGLTGLQLCRKIRAHAAGTYSYFIMVTNRADPDDILEGMSAGADDYLIKPLDHDDLQARLIAAARVTSLHRQLASQRAELEGLNRDLGVIARRDPLTGLGNRRALQEDLDLLVARAARYGHTYCMALIDIDYFKSYNDTYGHLAGDAVLQAVANQLKESAREGDALYRYGGDEFLCIFPEQSTATGSIAVERMRLGLERLAIVNAGSGFGVLTFSAGMAALDKSSKGVEEVVTQADKALYRAKQRGRNRVERPAALPALAVVTSAAVRST